MKKFIGEKINVTLPCGNFLEKKPGCPISFIWRGEEYQVNELISNWSNLSRKGDSGKNMREEHLQRAKIVGSWGVGRFYFTIKDDHGWIFTLYYDRAPRNSSDRKGKWILFTRE